MAVKKTTTRKRSTTTTTKRAKTTTTRAASKRPAKSRSAAKPAAAETAPVLEQPTAEAPSVEAPTAEAPEVEAPGVELPEGADRAITERPVAARPAVSRLGATRATVTRPAPAPRAGAGSASDKRPSRFTADHYLYAKGPEPAEGSMRRPGKWMIFVSRSRVDALWESIRRAVETGRLGYSAKVSTALPNPQSPDPKKHVICVYTHDQEDAADVRRVRNVLRGIGVTWKIPYKSDAATRSGQHEVTAGGPAAKYYE
jgi:hypothetical protein